MELGGYGRRTLADLEQVPKLSGMGSRRRDSSRPRVEQDSQDSDQRSGVKTAGVGTGREK
jgi:hypothetical protein